MSHGFRSSYRVWCGDTGVDREVAERALAHTVRNPVEAAYNRGTLFERRRAVMEALGGPTSWEATMLRDPKPVQPKEEFLLALVEGLVDDTARLDGLLRKGVASKLKLDSGLHAHLAEESKTGWLEWRVMKAAIAHLREQEPDAMRDAVGSPLLAWALDVAEGKRTPPKRPRGRDPLDNVVRDVVIADMVSRIHKLGHRALTGAAKDYDGSACHLVAERLGMSYEAIRRIWQNRRGVT